LSATVSQRLPGFAKLRLAERAADLETTAHRAELEALELRMVTEARRHYHEISYLDAAMDIIRTDRATLEHFEELARARYASGVGLQKDAIQIQAEITRLETRLADLAARRNARVAALNMLRNRPGAEVLTGRPSDPVTSPSDWTDLRSIALANRPELTAVDARIETALTRQDVAAKGGRPEFNVGLTYALIERRTDIDPSGNGRDVFGVSGGMTLPVWRTAINAGSEEAVSMKLAAEADRRAAIASIDFQLETLRGTIPEIERRLGLFSRVLLIQTEQALLSAEAAYAAGRADGLSLLDAERVLLDVRLSTERSRTDLAIAVAELEGTIGTPLSTVNRDPAPSAEAATASASTVKGGTP
jgi:outer membrane protein TolC